MRAPFILALAASGIAIDVYGNSWNRFVSHPLIACHPPVYGEAFWDVLHRYRVQLNLMRIHNLDSHNMRTFEVPGAGGIMLAPKTKEHAMFFEDKKEAFFFSDESEAAWLVRQILAMSTDDAARIRTGARRRSIDSGYTYRQRTADALSVIQKLLN